MADIADDREIRLTASTVGSDGLVQDTGACHTTAPQADA